MERRHDFTKAVTKEITLTEGTVAARAPDYNNPGNDIAMKVLASLASIVVIVVIVTDSY